MAKPLPRSVYQLGSPSNRAQFFLGKKLCVRAVSGVVCAGLIYETEAYGGKEDKACHGYANRRTARTAVMFGPGGVAYVYLCYGLHYLLNFVTGPAESPEAVLIRGVWIIEGNEIVARRRPRIAWKDWASGPGKVSLALDVGRRHNGCDLTGPEIWVEETGLVVPKNEIERTPRIGVNYAEEWAEKPLRFVWKNRLQNEALLSFLRHAMA